MQFSVTAVLTTLLAATALAAPAPEAEVKSMVAASTWTIENMKRTCDSKDTSCAWSFAVNNGSSKTSCSYTVKKSGNTKASRSPLKSAKCGAYTVTSAWSGQFGEGNGFTTLSVVDYNKKLIAYPAYTDKQLVNGKVVKPNLKFAVNKLA